MSNPSFSNIDMWLFELAEGNLSPEQVEQLERFLLNHPELDIDRDVWEMAKVDKQAIAYPNVADLERKRRPLAYFAFGGLLLLLIGSSSYMALTGQFGGSESVDLTAQHQQVKNELMAQIRFLKSQQQTGNTAKDNAENASILNSEVNGLNESASSESNGSNSNNSARNAALNNSGINSNATNAANVRRNDQTLTSSIGLLNMASAQNHFTNGSSQGSNANGNGNNANYSNDAQISDEEQAHGLSDVKQVGNREFYVREAKELDIYEGRVWNPRRSTSSNQTTASTGNKNASFRDKFNKFSRSLERMMNAPIALKNSRDPHYHVPGMTSTDINFSAAGTLIATRVQATSRLQWEGQENEQLMNQLSADGYSYGMRGGWGVQLNHQLYQNGGIQVAQAAFTYSPKISVSNWVSVEPSFRVKMGNKQLNAGQLENAEMVELERGNAHDFYPNGGSPIGKNLWYKDLGVGLLVNTKWFFAGVQADNLFKHKDNLYDDNWSDPRRAQNHFTATVGSDWVSRSEKLTLSPYLVYQKNEQLSEVWAGANFSYNWFNVGLATSSNLEPAASIGMKFDHFSIHYNADYTNSQMLEKKALSHQLTVRFVAKQNRFGKQLFKR